METQKLLIKKAKLIDPSSGLDQIGDILVIDGKIAEIGSELKGIEGALLINGCGCYAAPGFVDMHVHLRDPGQTYKGDILTECRAAAAGGVTSVCCMPNTTPTADSPEILEYIQNRAKDADARVYPVAAITADLSGKNLNDFPALKSAGAVAVSDDGRPVEQGGLMLKALQRAHQAGLPVISHCEDLSIINHGIIHKGQVSRELGVQGMDRASEDSITAREIVLAESSGTAIHIAHVSTKGSVQLIREAKARGVRVTCETAPHYMMMTDQLLRSRDANFRMNPPLREQEDCDAVIAGILDGTIDAIVTDHAPHSEGEKADFLKAPNGVIGLETSFAAAYTVLVKQRGMSLSRLVQLMSKNPADILHLPAGTLAKGAAADIVLFDTGMKWTVDRDKLHGKSKNTPFHGMELTGRVCCTILGGRVVYRLQD